MTPLEVRGEGTSARAELPAGEPWAAILPMPTLPDVSRLPGARIVGVASGERAGVRVVVGCLRAPSSKWVPGLQSVVFERATPMILGAASMHPALARGPIGAVPGAAFVEHLVGADGDRPSVVLHALAFAGPEADAVACSLACSEPASALRACDAVASSFSLAGDLRPEPPPGLVASAVLGAASHPVVALGIACAVALAVSALLLTTRPKLRPTARARRPRPAGPHR